MAEVRRRPLAHARARGIRGALSLGPSRVTARVAARGRRRGGTLPAAGRYRARPCGRSTFARGRPGPIRGRSRRSTAEGRRPGAGSRRDGGRRDDGPRGPPKAVAATDRPPPGLSPPGRLHGPHPFTSRRVHALLNSLFKVLFNFPSRYLSAIGPVPLFSLRWSLPPALGCIPKQPDSGRTAPGRAPPPPTGLAPSPAVASTCRWEAVLWR